MNFFLISILSGLAAVSGSSVLTGDDVLEICKERYGVSGGVFFGLISGYYDQTPGTIQGHLGVLQDALAGTLTLDDEGAALNLYSKSDPNMGATDIYITQTGIYVGGFSFGVFNGHLGLTPTASRGNFNLLSGLLTGSFLKAQNSLIIGGSNFGGAASGGTLDLLLKYLPGRPQDALGIYGLFTALKTLRYPKDRTTMNNTFAEIVNSGLKNVQVEGDIFQNFNVLEKLAFLTSVFGSNILSLTEFLTSLGLRQ